MMAMVAGIIGLISLFQKNKSNDTWIWVGFGEDPFKK